MEYFVIFCCQSQKIFRQHILTKYTAYVIVIYTRNERSAGMKKILIFSDTHGYTDSCLKAIDDAGHVDAIIHAGDCTEDAEDLESIYPRIPVYYVKGNNDFFSSAPAHMTVIIDGIKIFITHGHEQRVKYESSYSTLRACAAKAEADLIIFGHTHIPYTSYDGGVTTLNPGSVRFTRTYAIAEIEKGELKTKIVDI